MHERADCTTPLVAVPAKRMSDSARPFKRQVVLSTSEPGQERRIHSAREAAACLATTGPRRGTAYRAALISCHAALDGTATPESAQRAFIRAAMEVDIFVRETGLGH